MVVALGPGKFYGSSLPRPRMMIYTDAITKNKTLKEEEINRERVDPVMGVMEPLLSWAHEAHWSMGGLSFKRLRLQGKIEGNIKKLRSDQKKKIKNKTNNDPAAAVPAPAVVDASPPPLLPATKRRRRLALLDEDDEDDNLSDPVAAEEKQQDDAYGICRSSSTLCGKKQKRARNLVDDFDRVATSDSSMLFVTDKRSPDVMAKSIGVASRTRSARKSFNEEKEVIKKGKRKPAGDGTVNKSMANSPPRSTVIRTSPRLRSSSVSPN